MLPKRLYELSGLQVIMRIFGKVGFCEISHSEWEEIQNHIVEVWHFEKSGNGVKPVAGEYDKTNPSHVKKSDVIKINQGLL